MDVCKCFSKRPTALTKSPSSLRQKLDALLAYEYLNRESILDSPQTFIMPLSSLKSRLRELKEMDVENVRSYMLIYSIPKIMKLMSKKRAAKATLGEFDGSIVNYIANRLGWSQNQAEEAVHKCPAISKMNCEKVKD